MRIEVPALCVVALVGSTGSGKTTFAARHFRPTEILSSDTFRGLVSDDENDQSATEAAFDSLYYVAGKRLDAGRLTVIDATNVHKSAREQVLGLAKRQNCHAVAIVLNYPPEICLERNNRREGRNYPAHVIQSHTRALRRSLRHLKQEGFRYVYVLNSPEQAEEVEIVRTNLWNDRREETGPFDIIGDIHGCYRELCDLLSRLGYAVDPARCAATPPPGRKAVFLGDLCDRGPGNVQVLRLVMGMVAAGGALCVPGNHDVKLLKHLRTGKATLTHGLDITAAQLAAEPEALRAEVVRFLDGLISHYVLDGGRLVVAHAGLKEELQGRASGRVRQFCLYGDTTGETDEFGLPVRLNWAQEYRGRALVVYGHTPSTRVERLNNTVCVDTGCVFGGHLTAYCYPQGETVQVPAQRQYYQPAKPLGHDSAAQGDMLSVRDVLGRRIISTKLHRNITVQEENAAAALEFMSRFAVDPHWLIYLPPTMSPCETSGLPDHLEHPLEAFEYYRSRGVRQVVCEQKHMGSRAVIVLCRSEQAARERFGVSDGSSGVIYTRTGRHFFEPSQSDLETAILTRLRDALDSTDFWAEYATDWVCLDTELMPWSAKAQKLLVEQYAPTGRAGRQGLQNAVDTLEQAVRLQSQPLATAGELSGQTADLPAVLESFRQRRRSVERYVEAYRQYCWPVRSLTDYRVAPFHILATEGKVWSDEGHLTHLEVIRRHITASDPLFLATNHIPVALDDAADTERGVDWWRELTTSGGEGMVVKPGSFLAHGTKGELLQPAVKCRGREYLRIIYGPEYTLGGHLERLKKRSLHKKRCLALCEFSLGVEALERFVAGDPLHRVHECVFAVLAMESEPVDPRL